MLFTLLVVLDLYENSVNYWLLYLPESIDATEIDLPAGHSEDIAKYLWNADGELLNSVKVYKTVSEIFVYRDRIEHEIFVRIC
jgi:hypothetical protein